MTATGAFSRPQIPIWREDAMTLSLLMRQCLDYLLAVKGYSRETADNYDRTYRQFLAHVRGRGQPDLPRAFSDEAVASFLTDLGARGVKQNTLINKLSALSTLGRFGERIKDGRGRPILVHNPARSLEWPKPVQPETKFLHPDELRAFLAVDLPLRDAVARDLLVDTGIRVGEAVALSVGDVQEFGAQRFLAIRPKGRKHAGEEPQRVPLSAAVAELIRDFLLARGLPGAVEPLLLTPRGTRHTRSSLSQMIVRAGHRAGITRLPVSPHKLRHTANVVARLAGLDVWVRSRLLTHGDRRTLDRYEHLIPEELVRARVEHRQALERYITIASEQKVAGAVEKESAERAEESPTRTES